MRKILKEALRMVFLMAFAFIATSATLLSVRQSQEIPLYEEISHPNNVNPLVQIADTRAIHRSRNSALRVISLSTRLGGMSTSSGTYIKFEDKFYILTVAHGIIGGCEGTSFMTEKGLYHCKRVIAVNDLVDYAIIEVDEIVERHAVSIPRHLPRGHQWKKDFSIMTRTYYTGFPNAMGPFTLDGKVIGYNENDFVYIKSYGWSGCSGAGIFTQSGRLVAYVLALTVGQTQYGFNVAEDIIIAVPLFKINWAHAIKIAKEKQDDEKENRSPPESKLSDSAESDSGVRYPNP